MTVRFNHTIVNARDNERSAQFLAEILGLPSPHRWGPFVEVATAGRARIYIAGVFDAAAMEASVRKAFDAWPRGATVAPPAKPAARSGGRTGDP